ncbi:MAG: nucleotidyl transferase AbiEii/AbiGii toxin family protein [Brevibacterium sp.]
MSVNEARVQLQLLSRTGYPVWPTEYRDIDQRYSDAPPARLRVLTQPAFAPAKLSAWNDRAAPRDLYDLWAMAAHGMIDREAADLFNRYGPLTDPSAVSFSKLPSETEWQSALKHQGAEEVSAEEAAEVVREAWSHHRRGGP